MSMTAELDQSIERRLEIFGYTPEVLLSLSSAGPCEVIADVAPKDAEVVGCSYDITQHLILIVARSPEFKPVPSGGVIPMRTSATIRKISTQANQ